MDPRRCIKKKGSLFWEAELGQLWEIKNGERCEAGSCPLSVTGAIRRRGNRIVLATGSGTIMPERDIFEPGSSGIEGNGALMVCRRYKYFYRCSRFNGNHLFERKPKNKKKYVGKSKSPEAFARRQSAHNSALKKKGYKQKYKFKILKRI